MARITMVTPDPLHRSLAAPGLLLTPLAKDHREGLRAACAVDDAIWEIYPTRWIEADFDANFDALLGNPTRQPYAVLADGRIVGMTSWIDAQPAHRKVEIGGTFLTPAVRGIGVNGAMKSLMIGHAFASGYHRIEFRIDIRNARSLAAVRKLGAEQEGLLRRERVTWTGHVRDTAIFGLFPENWTGRAVQPA